MIGQANESLGAVDCGTWLLAACVVRKVYQPAYSRAKEEKKLPQRFTI